MYAERVKCGIEKKSRFHFSEVSDSFRKIAFFFFFFPHNIYGDETWISYVSIFLKADNSLLNDKDGIIFFEFLKNDTKIDVNRYYETFDKSSCSEAQIACNAEFSNSST